MDTKHKNEHKNGHKSGHKNKQSDKHKMDARPQTKKSNTFNMKHQEFKLEFSKIETNQQQTYKKSSDRQMKDEHRQTDR